MKTIQHFINGAAAAGEGSRTVPTFNPASGVQTGTLSLASSADVRSAVEAAKAAFPGWAETTPLRRARILNKFLAIVEERIEEMAALISSCLLYTSPSPRD